MAWKSLGAVTVAVPGVRQRLTANQAVPTARVGCEALLIQAMTGVQVANVGRIYIYDIQAGGAPMAVLAIPTANTIPSASATVPAAPGGLNAADYWLDADSPGDGAYVSYIRP